jgi:hypothetical protein
MDAALWQRWRQQAHGTVGRDAVDPLALAAYVEGRLDETQAEPIEDWLAEHPDALADLTAARAAAAAPLPQAASEALIARAAALVRPPAGATIIPFRAAAGARPPWRMAMAWSGIAASLLVASMGGFALGDNAYVSLVGQPAAAESTIHELLDPPSTLFVEDEEPAS